jgi:hypothetical protein
LVDKLFLAHLGNFGKWCYSNGKKEILIWCFVRYVLKNNETIACMKQQKYKKWVFLWINDRPEVTKNEVTKTPLVSL